MTDERTKAIEALAWLMHETYEAAAKEHGWRTQTSCRVPFDDLPEANRKTMLAVAEVIVDKYEPAVERERRLEILNRFEEPRKILEMVEMFPEVADRAVRFGREAGLNYPDQAAFETAVIEEAARAGKIPKCYRYELRWDEPGLVGDCRDWELPVRQAGQPWDHTNCPVILCCVHCRQQQPAFYQRCAGRCPVYQRWADRRRKKTGSQLRGRDEDGPGGATTGKSRR